jgi:hypothetical protein
MLTVLTPSRASSLPQGFGIAPGFWVRQIANVGVSLLAMAVGQVTGMSTVRTLSRAGSLLQGICGWLGILGVTDNQCRSKPARDGGGSGNGDVDCTDAIASRLTPTGGLWLAWDFGRDR